MKWKRRPIEDIRTMERLFTTAETEAAQAGEPHPGAEYLVLAALQLPEGSARRTFERLGTDPDGFRTALLGQDHGAEDPPVTDPATPHRPVRYGASGRDLFQEVVGLVRSEKSQIYGAYIVLVAAQLDYGATPTALKKMNVDRHELAIAARAELDDLGEI